MSQKFGGNPVIFEGNPYEEHAEQKHQLGARMYASNGDIYRYTKAASTDFIAGYLYTALAKEANHVNCTVAASNVVGDTKVVVDIGATAVDANEYDEGSLQFNDNSPEGEFYTIDRHEANAGSLETDFYVSPALYTATTVDSTEVSIIRNTWNRPAISQLIAERAAGVAVQDWDVSVAEFGWLKTHGHAAVLADTTGWTKGYTLAISNQVDGAMGVSDGGATMVIVGQGIDTGTAGEFNAVYLTIDG